MDTILGSDPPLHREDWHRLKGWYQAAVNHTPPPALVTLERITSERVNLYSYITPLGENIPISVEPFLVDDSVPTEEEIDWAVPRLRNNGSGGPSGMRAEHLKWWLAVARNNEREEAVVEQESRRKGDNSSTQKDWGGARGRRRARIRRLQRLPIGRGWWTLFRRRSGRGGLRRSPCGRRWS